MAITIRKTLHLDECDLNRLDDRNTAMYTMLNNKVIMRADDNLEGERQIEEAFTWLKENCKSFYSVRAGELDKTTVKYYIYFMNSEEMTNFVLSFPRDVEK